MKKLLMFAAVVLPICFYGARAETLDDAILLAQTKCAGISDKMSHMKTLAGINTAVTGVGTVAGVGATVSGVKKNNLDKEIDKIEEMIARYKNAKANVDNSHLASVYLDQDVVRAQLQHLSTEILASNKVESDLYATQIEQLESLRDMGVKQSKTLGNVRTGLMATSTSTNIAGVVIAANNNVDADLKMNIQQCLAATDILRDARMQAQINGADAASIAHADKIISACGEYAYTKLDVINNRALGAGVSSGVGVATGLGGTITSAMANSDKNRAADAGREKKLNTAANVLGGLTSTASLSATVFNATQIKAIKNVAKIADECEGALK